VKQRQAVYLRFKEEEKEDEKEKKKERTECRL